MNYQEHVKQMLEHLVQHNNAENVELCVNALCHALVGVVSHSIPDHDAMHETMEHLNEQMQKQACELHSTLHPDGWHKKEPEEEKAEVKTMDAETFLRDHFKPEHFNG